MNKKILVTPRTFGKADPVPMEMHREAGCEVITNPYGRLLTEEEVSELIQDVDGIIVGLDPLNASVLSKAKRLKAISKYGVGVNNIDLDYATQRGIQVANTPGANSLAVAELVIGLMFAVSRRICVSDRNIREGKWQQYPGLQVKGKVMGLIGTGQIGRHTGELARGLGMDVICYDLYPNQEWAASIGARYVPLQEIITGADFISIHVPLTDDTYHLISREELDQMKSSAVIINTARGGIVDEQALSEALQEGKIAGAGLDVFESEPLTASTLLELDNVVLTSHIGAHTRESVENMGRWAAANLLQILRGETPEFAVNQLTDGGDGNAS